MTPGTRIANNGNWRTAARWAEMLRAKCKVIVQTQWDGRPADLFFMLLGPESAAGAHVRALGRISRLLRRDSLRQALRDAADPAAFMRVVAESEAG